MKRLRLLLPVICLLLFAAGCSKEPTAFDIHTPDMVGEWQMTTYTEKNGTVHDFREQDVRFLYSTDGTGKKTVAGKLEYTLTYSYDGEHLYTTAAYPSTGQAQLMNDLCTIKGDTMTVHSYDEDATIVLQRLK